MIVDLGIAKSKILQELEKYQIKVLRVKETISESSIYIYTDVGVIRLSDHHNPLSLKKCVIGLTIPIDEKYLIKAIKLIKRK